MTNKFVWADLSTFDIDLATQFYTELFGWKVDQLDDDYRLCKAEKHNAAGLYPMPVKFQKIGLPSFWMSYLRVADINATVCSAEEHGGRIEVMPEPAPGGGLVALIRDPAGAGFTCYEGPDPGGRADNGKTGQMVWNELHVSDITLVRDFYSGIFGWSIEQSADDKNLYDIFNKSREAISAIQVTSNDLKGDKEYWGVYFSVGSFSEFTNKLARVGGEVIAEQARGAERSLLTLDSQGAAFYVVERNAGQSALVEKQSSGIKWRAISGLLLVSVAVLFEFHWLWGLLFLLWIIPDLITGSTHFLEHVDRKNNPIVYWLIIATWASLSSYLLLGWTG